MQMKILMGALMAASFAFAVETSAPAEQVVQNAEVPATVPSAGAVDTNAVVSAPAAEVPDTSAPAVAPVAEAPVMDSSANAAPEVSQEPAVPELDLAKLTAQDSDNFEEYSNRIKLIEENIGLCESKLEILMKAVSDSIPPLSPKAEGETDEAFLERQNKHELDVYKASKEKEEVALYMKRVSDMKLAVNTIKKLQTEMLGTILVTSVPEQAMVKISNQDISLKTPAKFEQVLPGNLTVFVSLDGYEPKNLPLVLKASENREMNVTLTPVSALANAAKDATTEDSSWTWRGYTRLVAFIAAAGFLGAGIYENYKAVDRADEYNSLEVRTTKARAEAQDDVNMYEVLRNGFYAAAGVWAGIGVITFFF